MKKRNLVAALTLGGALAGAPAASGLAATQDAPDFYIGGGVGYFKADESGIDLDDEEVAWKAFAGFNFIPWLGIEAGWVSFGEVSSNEADFESDGWTIAAVGYLPLGRFAPYAKIGQYFWDTDASFEGDSISDDGNDTFGGVGILFKLTEVVDLRAEYERYKIDDADIDLATIGAQIRF